MHGEFLQEYHVLMKLVVVLKSVLMAVVIPYVTK